LVCAKTFITWFKLAKDPVEWFNILLAKAISLIIETKLNLSDFWEYYLKDNGDSIWKPAIRAPDKSS
jgi:hypothetical protein